MAKKRKGQSHKPWCWYCDREFEDEKILITHQKAKHFKCMYCHKKLNSASGLVIHVAQIHKETITTVPNAVVGHDTPEVEIFGMEGVPADDLQRHYKGESIVPYKRIKVAEGGLLPLLAAQKASVPDVPDLPTYTPAAGPMLSSMPPITVASGLSSGPVVASAPAIISPFYTPHAPPSVSPLALSVSTSITSSAASSTGHTSVPLVTSPSFDNIVISPSVDSNAIPIPGAIIIAPDLHVSMEERRAQLERYRHTTKEGTQYQP